MIKTFRVSVLASAVLAATSIWSLALAQNVTLRVNNFIPPTHPLVARVIAPWAEQVSRATQGRVKVELTTASLGTATRQYDLASEGIADITFGNHAYTSARFLLTRVAELPFLSDSAEVLSVALWRTQQKFFEKAQEHQGVKLLTLFTHGPGQLYTSSRAISQMSDFKGLKLRSVGSLTAEIIQIFGAVPISVPVTQVYELLSNGVADGTVVTDDGVVSFKLQSILKHGLAFPGGLYNVTFFIVMNQGKWDSLSPEDKRAIESVSGEPLAQLAGKMWDEQDALARIELEKAGVKVAPPSSDLLRAAKERLADQDTKWIALASKRNVDGAPALAFLREEIARYKRP